LMRRMQRLIGDSEVAQGPRDSNQVNKSSRTAAMYQRQTLCQHQSNNSP
jgi:hypothetical protein